MWPICDQATKVTRLQDYSDDDFTISYKVYITKSRPKINKISIIQGVVPNCLSNHKPPKSEPKIEQIISPLICIAKLYPLIVPEYFFITALFRPARLYHTPTYSDKSFVQNFANHPSEWPYIKWFFLGKIIKKADTICLPNQAYQRWYPNLHPNDLSNLDSTLLLFICPILLINHFTQASVSSKVVPIPANLVPSSATTSNLITIEEIRGLKTARQIP